MRRFSDIVMIPILILNIIVTWTWDLCCLKRPRTMGPSWCETHSQMVQECEQDEEQRKKSLPAALPRKRKRALTSPQAFSTWQGKYLQDTAMLLSKLPVEVRQIVYMMVLKGSTTTLHIVPKTEMYRDQHSMSFERGQPHLGCWTCPFPPHVSSCNQKFPALAYPPRCSGPMDKRSRRRLSSAPYGNLLPLLLTCRQIYAEAIDLLYSSSTFSFAEPRMVTTFASTILPQRLNAIRKLHLERALPFDELFGLIGLRSTHCSREEEKVLQSFCSIINRMKGLQELRIDMFNLEKRQHKSAEVERRILQPLMMMRRINTFIVRVSWDSMGSDAQDAPFQLLRPPKKHLHASSQHESFEFDED